MNRPEVGLPAITGAGCAYSEDIDTPRCGKPPSTHVAVVSPAWGPVSLVSCPNHVPIARAAGELRGEHPYRPECDTTDCWAGVL